MGVAIAIDPFQVVIHIFVCVFSWKNAEWEGISTVKGGAPCFFLGGGSLPKMTWHFGKSENLSGTQKDLLTEIRGSTSPVCRKSGTLKSNPWKLLLWLKYPSWLVVFGISEGINSSDLRYPRVLCQLKIHLSNPPDLFLTSYPPIFSGKAWTSSWWTNTRCVYYI